MPTYDYRCPKGHEFELFQKMSEEPGAPCPRCGERAERQISGGGGFLFKGEGFYITDYRSEEYRKKASAESGGAEGGSKDGASGEPSTEKPPKTKPSEEKSAKETVAKAKEPGDGPKGSSA